MAIKFNKPLKICLSLYAKRSACLFSRILDFLENLEKQFLIERCFLILSVSIRIIDNFKLVIMLRKTINM